MRWRGCSRTAVPVSISYFYNFIIFPWARLPPNRPEPPVHRERNRRTDHAGHNKKYQAEAEYCIGKVQRTNCGTPHNKQGPCGQADALNVSVGSAAWRGCRGAFGGTASGGNTNYIFATLHLSRGDLQRNRGTKGRLIRLRPTKEINPPVVQRRTWEAPVSWPIRGLSLGRQWRM
jgi:hypothetical protein